MRRKLLRAAAVVAAAMFVVGSVVNAGDIPYAGGAGGAGGVASADGVAKGGSGGTGGSADANGDTTADSVAAGAAGGAASGTGITGDDGTAGESVGSADAPLEIALPAATDTLSLLGGTGGAGGAAAAGNANGGNGAAGGSVYATLTGDTMATATNIKAGAGGAAGTYGDADFAGGEGAAGGNAVANYRGEALTLEAAMTLTAGAAGSAAANVGQVNGAGGNAEFHAENAAIMMDGGSVVLVGAANDADVAATAAGSVVFHAKSIDAGTGGGAFTAATAAKANSAFDVKIGAINVIDGNMTVDLSALDVDTNAAGSSIGAITIGDGSGTARTLTLTAAVGEAQGWNGALKVVGEANVLATNGLTEVKALEFDLTGVEAGDIMLTDAGGITGSAATTVKMSNATAAHLGAAITLATVATGIADKETTDTVSDSDGNTATIGGKVALAGAGGNLTYTADSFNAAGNWVQDAVGTTTIASTATTPVSYKVGGVLTVGKDDDTGAANDLTFDSTNGDLIVDIGTLRVADADTATATTVTFTATAAATTGADYATIGEIVMDENSDLTVVNSNLVEWTGNLTTTNSVSLGGLDLSGKSITANLTDDYDFDAGVALITENAANLTADTDTAVTVNLTAAQAGELIDVENLQIFDGALNVGAVEAENVAIKSGAFDILGDFNAALGVYAANGRALNANGAEEVHNALLSAPATMALLNGGADVVENVSSSFSPMAFSGNYGSAVQVGAFAALSGGTVEVDTGSDIESDNFHLLVGPGLRINAGSGKVDLGAFFEAGWGSYDAFNSFARGEGDTNYYGAGLLARYDSCNGFYAEASLRFGEVESEYQSRGNVFDKFESDSSYVGGHLGLGYIFRPSDKATVDVFAKGLLTAMDGDNVTDRAGYELAIDDTTSLRTQLGAKYSYNFGGNVSLFAKAAWEHEFDGETAARYGDNNGRVDIRKSDTGGSSAIGELGVSVRLAERAVLEASIYGMAGRRQGFGGSVNVGFGF